MFQCALNQHHANHRHLGAILLRYCRHPTKPIEQIAAEIKSEVAECLKQQEASKVAAMSRTPEILAEESRAQSPLVKRRKIQPASPTRPEITANPGFQNWILVSGILHIRQLSFNVTHLSINLYNTF